MEKSICRTLSLPQPPRSLRVCRIASLRSDFAAADTSSVHGSECANIIPSVGGTADDDAALAAELAAPWLGPGLDTVCDPQPTHPTATTLSTARVDLMSAQRLSDGR